MFGLVFNEWQHAQVRHTVEFCFIEWFNLKPRCDIDAVDERQLVRGFSDSAGRDNTDLVGIDDAVFVKLFAIGVQDRYTVFDRGAADLTIRERVTADTDGLAERFDAADLKRGLINFGDLHPHRRRTDVDHRDKSRWFGGSFLRWGIFHERARFSEAIVGVAECME